MISCECHADFAIRKYTEITMKICINENLLCSWLTEVQTNFWLIYFTAAPQFVEPLEGQSLIEGETAKITCRVTGRPRPSVVWKGPNGTVLLPNYRTMMTEDQNGSVTLEITNCTFKDEGEYQCVVSNDVGSVSCSGAIRVKGKNKMVMIMLRHSGSIYLKQNLFFLRLLSLWKLHFCLGYCYIL